MTGWSLPRLAAYLAQQGIVQIGPVHLGRVLAEANLSFQRTRTWKASPDPDYDANTARLLELTRDRPADGGVVIAFDQMGPVSLRPTPGTGWAPKGGPRDSARTTTAATARATSLAPTTSMPTACASTSDHAAAVWTTSHSWPRSAPAIRSASGSTGFRTTSRRTEFPTSAATSRTKGSRSSRPRPTPHDVVGPGEEPGDVDAAAVRLRGCDRREVVGAALRAAEPPRSQRRATSRDLFDDRRSTVPRAPLYGPGLPLPGTARAAGHSGPETRRCRV